MAARIAACLLIRGGVHAEVDAKDVTFSLGPEENESRIRDPLIQQGLIEIEKEEGRLAVAVDGRLATVEVFPLSLTSE